MLCVWCPTKDSGMPAGLHSTLVLLCTCGLCSSTSDLHAFKWLFVSGIDVWWLYDFAVVCWGSVPQTSVSNYIVHPSATTKLNGSRYVWFLLLMFWNA